jgi:hypothetical protein
MMNKLIAVLALTGAPLFTKNLAAAFAFPAVAVAGLATTSHAGND